MQDFKYGDLTITVNLVENMVIMTWLGYCDLKDPSAELHPYLQEMVAAIKGHALTLKFNHLEFMNSSSILVILKFLARLDVAGVQTVVAYDKRSDWQNMSFPTLQRFCQRMKHIMVQGE